MFGYNNAAVVLAGHVIEAVTGMTYEDALTRFVLRRLGMDDTYLFPEQVLPYAVAAGHEVGPGGARVSPGLGVAALCQCDRSARCSRSPTSCSTRASTWATGGGRTARCCSRRR